MKYYDTERNIVLRPRPDCEIYIPDMDYDQLPPFTPSYRLSKRYILENPRKYIPLSEYIKSFNI